MANDNKQQENNLEIPMREVAQMKVWSEDSSYILYPTPRSLFLPPSPPSNLIIFLYAISMGFSIAQESYDYLQTDTGTALIDLFFYYPLHICMLLSAIIAPILKSDKLIFFGIVVQCCFLPSYLGNFYEYLLKIFFNEIESYNNTYYYLTLFFLLLQIISMIVFLVTSANMAYIYRHMREYI